MIECGFSDFTVPAFFSVVAPPGTPKPIVDRLNAVINDELGGPEMQGVLEKMPAERGTGSPQAFGDFIAAERAKWQAVAKAANLRID